MHERRGDLRLIKSQTDRVRVENSNWTSEVVLLKYCKSWPWARARSLIPWKFAQKLKTLWCRNKKTEWVAI